MELELERGLRSWTGHGIALVMSQKALEINLFGWFALCSNLGHPVVYTQRKTVLKWAVLALYPVLAGCETRTIYCEIIDKSILWL